jgi:hypothetical protein
MDTLKCYESLYFQGKDTLNKLVHSLSIINRIKFKMIVDSFYSLHYSLLAVLKKTMLREMLGKIFCISILII